MVKREEIDNEDMLIMITRYLVKHEYFKTAKSLILESNTDFRTLVDTKSKAIHKRKLKHIVQAFAKNHRKYSEAEELIEEEEEAVEQIPASDQSEIEEEVDEEAENEKLVIHQNKKLLEEEFRQKIKKESGFTKKINTQRKEEVVHCDKHFSRVNNVSHVNTEIFEQDYAVF